MHKLKSSLNWDQQWDVEEEEEEEEEEEDGVLVVIVANYLLHTFYE